MSRRQTILVPAQAAGRMRDSQSAWGQLRLTQHGKDDAYKAVRFQTGNSGALLPVNFRGELSALTQTDDQSFPAFWHKASAEAHAWHWSLSRRDGVSVPFDAFRRLVPTVTRRVGVTQIVITHVPDLDDVEGSYVLDEFAAWLVGSEEVIPMALVVEPDIYGLPQLLGHWPVVDLLDRSVLLVGVGSIGGVVASALAAYGLGQLHLLDPDRLLWHNLVRHVLPSAHVGRFKTDALRDELQARWPCLTVTSHVADVVDDAGLARRLLTDVDAVVCAADGIAPRRVVSHLARRAGKDAILASVLEDGAYGEILRLRRSPDHGCLLCRRAPLYEAGQMDPERVQERGYGDGNPHRPMTAVGPDLALVGDLTAKVTVASILDRLGKTDQVLPGEQAIVSLRPVPGYAEPFESNRAGTVAWHATSPPREDCFTCGTA